MGQVQPTKCIDLLGVVNGAGPESEIYEHGSVKSLNDFVAVIDPAIAYELWKVTDGVIGFDMIRSDGQWFYYRCQETNETNICSLEASRANYCEFFG